MNIFNFKAIILSYNHDVVSMQFVRGGIVWNCLNGHGFYQQGCSYAVCTLNDTPHFAGIAK